MENKIKICTKCKTERDIEKFQKTYSGGRVAMCYLCKYAIAKKKAHEKKIKNVYISRGLR